MCFKVFAVMYIYSVSWKGKAHSSQRIKLIVNGGVFKSDRNMFQH